MSGAASNPKVTFVVPCYKLGHLLGECVESILTQTYKDFEVLIMDDCSPDTTPEVAQSFKDPRVKHIRNNPNLGHLRNYNKGIEMARGEYVWLISADDRLRVPYVLERYVKVMEAHPQAGFACCPAIAMQRDEEVGVAKYSVQAEEDTIFKAASFLTNLLGYNCVIAASGMVRKSCYEAHGAFPLDLPYAGDWYLWCLFALHYQVAYFAEPMVNYRRHEGTMTSALAAEKIRVCVEDDLKVMWRIKEQAERKGDAAAIAQCRFAIALECARHVSGKYQGPGAQMSLEECEAHVRRFATSHAEARWVWARVLVSLGDTHVLQGDYPGAREFYRRGLAEDRSMAKVWVKCLLLRMGKLGVAIRHRFFALTQIKQEGLVKLRNANNGWAARSREVEGLRRS